MPAFNCIIPIELALTGNLHVLAVNDWDYHCSPNSDFAFSEPNKPRLDTGDARKCNRVKLPSRYQQTTTVAADYQDIVLDSSFEPKPIQFIQQSTAHFTLPIPGISFPALQERASDGKNRPLVFYPKASSKGHNFASPVRPQP
jgi:hypothetical protein